MKTTKYSDETKKLLHEIADELGVNLDPLELDPLELDPLELEPVRTNRTNWEDWETRINSGI
jgi:hypothetical protein